MSGGSAFDFRTPLVFEGRIEEDDAVTIQHYADRLNPKPLVGLWVVLMAVTLSAVGWWRVTGDFGWWGVAVTAWLMVVWVWWAMETPPMRVVRARWAYRSDGDMRAWTRVTLLEDCVQTQHKWEAAPSSRRWKEFGFVLNVTEGLLFYDHTQRLTIILPARVLEDDNLRERALAVVRRALVPVRRADEKFEE